MRALDWLRRSRLLSVFFRRKTRTVARRTPTVRVEHLEGLRLLSAACPVISGFVFEDCNPTNPALTNNGLFDPGERPIANSRVELRDATDAVIGTALTDANGFYSFETNGSVPATTQTISQLLTIPPTLTNFELPLLPPLELFDPSLGTLTAVRITNQGSLQSTIQSENLSTSSGATITGFLTGSFELIGLSRPISFEGSSATEPTAVSPFVPPVDFQPPSGVTFPPLVSAPSETMVLTDPADLAFYTASDGRSQINPQMVANATAGASAPGGNLSTRASTSASAIVTVTYEFTPNNCLADGNYTVVQTPEPAGFISGKVSSNGVIVPQAGPPDTIPITLAGADAPNNNFGELLPAPNVVDVKRLGVHHQPTRFVLTFDQDLNPVEAQDVGNYSITSPGRNGRFGDPNDRAVGIRSASYNPSKRTVTLTTNRRLNVHNHYLVKADLEPLSLCLNGTEFARVVGGKKDLGPVVGPHGRVFTVQPRNTVRII